MESITISCDDCLMQHTTACADCVVTFVCDRSEGGPVVMDAPDARVVHLLGERGLMPRLRQVRRTG